MGFFIDMIAVGEGDSFLLTLEYEGSEDYILIDGGPVKLSKKLVSHLKAITNGYLDLVIGTHLDTDHIGGLPAVIDEFDIGRVVLNVPANMEKWIRSKERLIEHSAKVNYLKKLTESISAVEGLFQALDDKYLEPEQALQGTSFTYGEDIILNVLNPTKERLALAWTDEFLNKSVSPTIFEKAEAPATSPNNDASIILELVYKNEPYALFPADAGAEVIKEVTEGKSYTFLKVPHHGSKTGLDEELIKQIKPKTVYIPVGENPHGHPVIEILDMLQEAGAKTFCSEKTKDCRKECKEGGFGNLCHRKDKDFRPRWSNVDPTDCKNNKKD